MLILITGGTGLLGNNVVRVALDQGHRVRVLTRSDQPLECFEGLELERMVGDITDPSSVEDAVRGCDAVVNSAGLVYLGWKRLEEANRINGEGAGYMAKAARRAGIRLVHVSTTNTLAVGRRHAPADEETAGDGQVPCTYVTSKRLGDALVHEQIDQGGDVVIVHPGFMLGPWDWKPSSGEIILQLQQRFTPLVPMGGICLCDARDVAAGVLSALENGITGRHYILGGENWTHFRLWRTIAQALGRPAPWSPIGPLGPRALGAIADVLVRCGMKEPQVNGAAVRLASQCHFYDSQRAIDELGYRNRPSSESIRDAIAWFRHVGRLPPV